MFVVTAPVDRDQHVRGTVENCPELSFSLLNVTCLLMEAARVAVVLDGSAFQEGLTAQSHRIVLMSANQQADLLLRALATRQVGLRVSRRLSDLDLGQCAVG